MSAILRTLKSTQPCHQWRSAAAGRIPAIMRHHHTAAPLRQPFKDDQDRESLKPRRAENTMSGDDQSTAAQDEAAFSPNKTSPEEEKETAGKDTKENPLEFSPANRDMSNPKEAAKDKSEGSRNRDKSKSSGFGKQ